MSLSQIYNAKKEIQVFSLTHLLSNPELDHNDAFNFDINQSNL